MSCVFGFGTRLLFGSVRRGNNSNLRLDGSWLNLRTVCVNTNTRGRREGRGHKTRFAPHHTIALNTNARLSLNTNARLSLNTNARLSLNTNARLSLNTNARLSLNTHARYALNTN